jgi:hypothetical protein
MTNFLKSSTTIIVFTLVSLILSGCSKTDSTKASSTDTSQKKVIETENQNLNKEGEYKNRTPNYFFSKNNYYSNLTVGNLTVKVSLAGNYAANLYNLPLNLNPVDGVVNYCNNNSEKKQLIALKNGVPILLETIDKGEKYTAQEIYYYARYGSRSISIYDNSRFMLGTVLADKVNEANFFGKFIEKSNLEFVKTSTRKGATGNIKIEEKTNFTAYSFSSISLYPLGLAPIAPWNQNDNPVDKMQLENFRLIFRIDSDELLMISDQSFRISDGDNLRFQQSGHGSDGYPISLDNAQVFHRATETELLPFQKLRKSYSLKDEVEYKKELLYNEYFEEFVNSVVTKSLAYTKSHAGLGFTVSIDSGFRMNIQADANGQYNPKDGGFSILSDPFDLFSNGQRYILEGAIKGENVEFDKTVKWVFANEKGRAVDLPDQWTLRQFNDPRKVKLSLAGSKGEKSYKLRFLEMNDGFRSKLPFDKLRNGEYTGIAIMVVEAYGYPFPFFTGINELTDGSIKVDGVNGIPTFTLKPKSESYIVEDEPDLIFSVQKL